MRRHVWTATTSLFLFRAIQRCGHCGTERVRDEGTKTLYGYRGGNARTPGTMRPLPTDRWAYFHAGVIPVCVERR